MAAHLRRVPLICSALLGALVVSCGGPPIYEVAPPAPAAEPAPAPAPQGGLQGQPEPVQVAPPVQAAPSAPVVIPAPAAPPPAPLAPAPATRPPVPVTGRPGGASPLVELSDAGKFADWKKQQSKFCAQAGYSSLEPGCVRIQKNHVDQDDNPIQGKYKNCDDGNVSTPDPAASVDGKDYIKAGTEVTVKFRCDPVEKDKKKKQDPPTGSESQTDNLNGAGG